MNMMYTRSHKATSNMCTCTSFTITVEVSHLVAECNYDNVDRMYTCVMFNKAKVSLYNTCYSLMKQPTKNKNLKKIMVKRVLCEYCEVLKTGSKDIAQKALTDLMVE